MVGYLGIIEKMLEVFRQIFLRALGKFVQLPREGLFGEIARKNRNRCEVYIYASKSKLDR